MIKAPSRRPYRSSLSLSISCMSHIYRYLHVLTTHTTWPSTSLSVLCITCFGCFMHSPHRYPYSTGSHPGHARIDPDSSTSPCNSLRLPYLRRVSSCSIFLLGCE